MTDWTDVGTKEESIIASIDRQTDRQVDVTYHIPDDVCPTENLLLHLLIVLVAHLVFLRWSTAQYKD